jgi:hypothetical protein
MLTDDARASMRRDIMIASDLRRTDLYQGVTTPAMRMELQRHEILRTGRADMRWRGKETWAQMFERVHGEALK